MWEADPSSLVIDLRGSPHNTEARDDRASLVTRQSSLATRQKSALKDKYKSEEIEKSVKNRCEKASQILGKEFPPLAYNLEDASDKKVLYELS